MRRELRGPIAGLTLLAFVSSLFPSRSLAADTIANAPQQATSTPPNATNPPAAVTTATNNSASVAEAPAPISVPEKLQAIQSLPLGGDKSGVSSQAISVPQGAGKINGMGESFSAQLSTGIATYSVPFSLPAARGAAQLSLGLSYSSSLGHGLAGIGWDVGVPSISRQTDRGLPTYDDPTNGGPWKPTQDRFVFAGGQELVPICLVANDLTCTGAINGEVMPAWSAGYMYFRSRVDGAFERFFWSPDHKTWRVQDKGGIAMELGVPLNDANNVDGLERDPTIPDHIFRWNLVRQYDSQGNANPSSGAPNPSNLVVYQWTGVNGMGYLRDIFDTPPVGSNGDLTKYAHHSRLGYESRPDPTTSYHRGYRVDNTLRLQHVDVTSTTMGASGAREFVRRYHVAYDSTWHPSLLSTVQLEGRCNAPILEDNSQNIICNDAACSPACATLPPITFSYQHVDGRDVNNKPQAPDLPGFEAFDERLTTMSASPKHSLDESLTDLFDINSDGLTDVLVTAPGLYKGNHAVFFNGDSGNVNTFYGATMMAVNGVLGANATDISLDNPNVSEHDVDGDAIVNLLHMPLLKQYAVYTPTLTAGNWSWEGRVIATASQQSPKINFQQNRDNIKVMDVNGDGLVDVVYNSGTELQTFLALGRYPGGDGQYGHAVWTGKNAATISNDPLTACVPWAGTPARFSDSDVRLADMNGDGLVDIVRTRKGDLKYWPGRGNGFWGTGALDDCKGGSFGQNREIAMTSPPIWFDPDDTKVRLDDVNGDGLDDMVQIRFNAVDIWINVDGTSWTKRHVMAGAPISSITNRARLVDMNGSGTRDVLWGDGLKYRFADLAGGVRPWVLTHVDNGLGKTTDLEYSTSTAHMLAAETAGNPWTRKAPMVLHIVTKSTEHDNLKIVGRPEGDYITTYEYRDPVYDGRQREFRGFASAKATRIGDGNSPPSSTESTFLLGDCKNEANANPDPCSLPERWQDNPREALKGLPVLSESYDLAGPYLSTTHHTYRLRQLYSGLDGRAVRHAFEHQSDSYAYDAGPFQPGVSNATLPEVELEANLGTVTADTSGTVKVRSAKRAHLRGSTEVDGFGNAMSKISEGCVDGCSQVDEVITSTTAPARRNDEPTGWLWRTTESYVTGSLSVAKRHHQFIEYDVAGNPSKTTAELTGTLGLHRFHESNKAVASTPSSASVDGTITLAENTYDAYGNLTDQTAPNGRCRDVAYDNVFAQLPTSETVHVGALNNGCGSVALTAQASYDRGQGLVTDVLDLHDEHTHVDYDGFGRLLDLYKPDPLAATSLSPLPSVKIEYLLTTNPAAQPYSLLHTQTQDGSDPSVSSYRDAWAYVDGMGRTILALDQADAQNGDGGDWVIAGLTEYDQKGAAMRAYLPWFYTGSPQSALAAYANQSPPTKYQRQRYDAFGRLIETYGLDGAITLRNTYHALGQDASDAADLAVGPHANTPASALKDGHGRSLSMTERIHAGNVIEQRITSTQYLPTGEPTVITRTRGNDKVVRWMRYDSLGRMVLNVEPNTTKNFNADPSTDPSTLEAWRYAYDDNGDLVGVSDARGCGENVAYDAGGRLLAEDYSPCLDSQAVYSAPDLSSGVGTEVLNHYDTLDSSTPNTFPVDKNLIRGRIVSVTDRASKTLTRYDGRGRTTGIARRVAVPGAPDPDPALRFAPRWYMQEATFDGADRPVEQSSGAQVSELLGAGQKSTVTTDYTKRGIVKSVQSSYGSLVDHVFHDADGLPNQIQYGDLAKTTTDFGHDDRRRLQSVQTTRGPPSDWTSPPVNYSPAPQYGQQQPTDFQLILEDAEFLYDNVDNPVELRDWRAQGEWPSGAKPVTRKVQYDDLYRVSQVDYQYSKGDDSWTDPFDNEDTGSNTDTRRAAPSPHVSFAKRALKETFGYDWLGNTTKTGDDANGFYDRSLGDVTNDSAKPYQLKSATNESTNSAREGHLDTKYDDAGDLTSMALTRAGPCLPNSSHCSQRFAYEWDEVGRLSRARRWDEQNSGVAADPVPNTTADVELRYAYDGGDQRVLKTAVDANNNERHSVYIFASLELRRAEFKWGDYVDDRNTEVAYLFAHGVRIARLHYSDESLPTLTSGKLHVLLELPDHLGSSAIVLNRETGELVERSTYLAQGTADSDYRTQRWDSFREDYRFTGKEEDVEVGLEYFGARYFAPGLGRWVSADPLAVQSPGKGDPDLYAYVRSMLLSATDSRGLDGLQSPETMRRADVAQRCDGASGGCGWANLKAVTSMAAEAWSRLQHKIFAESDKNYEASTHSGLTPVSSPVATTVLEPIEKRSQEASGNALIVMAGSIPEAKVGGEGLRVGGVAGTFDCAACTASRIFKEVGIETSPLEVQARAGLPQTATTYAARVQNTVSYFNSLGIKFADGPATFRAVEQGGVKGNYVLFNPAGDVGGHVVFGEVTDAGIKIIDEQRGLRWEGPDALRQASKYYGSEFSKSIRVESVADVRNAPPSPSTPPNASSTTPPPTTSEDQPKK